MFISELNKTKLKAVLAVYDNYVSYHNYYNNDLSAGEPITEETAKNLFNFLYKEDFANSYFFENIIPNNILKYKENKKFIIWYTKPCNKYLQFLSNLPIENDSYPMPYLIWKLDANSLSLFATKSIPNKKNINLYHAPFLNIDNLGNVCMGSSKFLNKENEYTKIIEQVEKGFFASYFSHTNHNNILTNNKSIIEMYHKQQTQSNKEFDYDLLNLIKNINLIDICNE